MASSSDFVTRPSWFVSYFRMNSVTAWSWAESTVKSHEYAGIIDSGSTSRGFQWCA
jgi:hypothetical protein